jgi:hypothetical protein
MVFKNGVKRTACIIVLLSNYSFIVQGTAQSFHWNNLQATFHPFVCYYRDEIDINDDGGLTRLKHCSFVVISESNNHDTIAVHLFQRVLILFLTDELRTPTKIIYFSNGCAAQYENCKNFTNLCHHVNDSGMQAEWHFFCNITWQGSMRRSWRNCKAPFC